MKKSPLVFVLVLLCAVVGHAQSQSQSTPTPTPTPTPSTTTSSTQPSAELASSAATAPASAATAAATQEKGPPVRIARFDKPPVIDGKLDEAVWGQATIFKNFLQTQPGDNIAPSKPTEALIGYDAKFLYVAFRAHDDAGKVRATVAKRDNVFDDDNVRIYLDTFNDQRKCYVMVFNPLGVQADGTLTEGRGEDYSVDIVMDSKGILTDDGYTVEVAIPFKSLRYEAGKGKLWGIHLFRRIKRFNNELDSWMPMSRNVSGFLSQEGRITGLENISTERTLELIPSLTLSETGKKVRSIPPSILNNNPALVDSGRFVNQPIGFDPGLTAKFGITPTITLDLALNPDFAQIEADQTVVTVNQRFPIFFDEKRPFFLEGIDIFRTPLTALHTRAIVDPDVAVKLTGKRGRNTFGLMLASDNAPGNFVGDERLDPNNARFLDKNAYIGVLRLKRDVGKASSLGMLATTYNFIEKHNHLGAVDGRFRLDPQTVFTFQVLGTNSRRFFRDPDLGRSIYRTGNGFGYYWEMDKAQRHFGYNVSGQGRTQDYRADVGFTRRVNTNRFDVFTRYNSEPKPKARLTSWRVYNSLGGNYDWQGRMQNWTNETQLQYNFPRQTTFGVGVDVGYERIFEEEFGRRRTLTRRGTFAGDDAERSTPQKLVYVFAGTTPSKKYTAFLIAFYGWGSLDLDFGAGPKFPRVSPQALLDPNAQQDPGPGNSLDIQSNFAYQPTKALRATLDYTKSRLVRRDTGRVAFDDKIFALRTTYQFTRFTFARGRIDYDTLASSVRGQFLLGWTPNPGTSLYVGYNDDLNRNGVNPFSGQLEPGFRRNGRTFFVKMSYLFRRSF